MGPQDDLLKRHGRSASSSASDHGDRFLRLSVRVYRRRRVAGIFRRESDDSDGLYERSKLDTEHHRVLHRAGAAVFVRKTAGHERAAGLRAADRRVVSAADTDGAVHCDPIGLARSLRHVLGVYHFISGRTVCQAVPGSQCDDQDAAGRSALY